MKVIDLWLIAFSIIQIFAGSDADFEVNFLGKFSDPDPQGILVNEDGRSIRIDENRAIPEEGPNYVAVIKYNGNEVPGIASVDGGGIHPQFTIVVDNGQFYLQLENSLDYENRATPWIVRLSPTTDPEAIFTAFVVDVNDQAPYFTEYADEPCVVNEGAPPSVLFTYVAEDDDTMDGALKYSLRDLQNEADTPFEINEVTGELSLVGQVDYQLQTTYRLQIMASDSGDIHVTNAPMVTIVNVIDIGDLPPRWISFSYRLDITEGNEAGTDIFTYRAVDDDSGVASPIVYELEGVEENSDGVPYLTIDEFTGQLRAAVVIDAEEAPESFDFVVVARETLAPFEEIRGTVAFFVQDINDHEPRFLNGEESADFPVLIPENWVGALPDLADLRIVDRDRSLEHNQFVASLRSATNDPNLDQWLNANFDIVPSSGYGGGPFSILVKSGVTVDVEDPANPAWQEPIEFVLTVAETLDPQRFAEGRITLRVEDLNDNSPQFQNTGSDGAIEFAVSENVGIVPFFTVSAMDADRSPEFGTNSIRYFWAEAEPNDLFLDERTGRISTRNENAFDRESLPQEIYIIEAADSEAGQDSRNMSVVLRLIITDFNDEPPIINSVTRQAQIPENIPVDSGPIIQGIVVSDPDETTNLAVDCEIQGPIEVVRTWFRCASTRNEVTGNIDVSIVRTEVQPDYEVTNRVDIALTAVDRDADDNVLQSTVEVFSITITDVNDVAPVFDPLRPIFVTETPECEDGVECQSDIEREIYQFRATDLDSSPNEIQFSIDSATLDLLEINAATGILSRRAIRRIDREAMDYLLVDVTVMNCDVDGNCDESLSNTLYNVQIDIVDINDERPVFTDAETDFIAVEGPLVPGVKTEIHQFHATDADEGRFGTVNYLLDPNYLNGHGFDQFEIDRFSGILSIQSEIDREVDPTFDLRVLARDNNGSQSNYNEIERIITIRILDVNDEKPQFSDETFLSLTETEIVPETVLGTVQVHDEDELGNPNSEVSVELVNVTWSCRHCGDMEWPEYFEGRFDTGTFQISATQNLHTFYGTYNFSIRARDNGQPTQETQVFYIFEVLDFNDNAPLITYPTADTHLYIKQDLPVNTALIEWNEMEPVSDLTATDFDDPLIGNGQVEFFITPGGDADHYFRVESGAGRYYLVVNSELELRDDPIQVEIIARDLGTSPLESPPQIMQITIVPEINEDPYFLIGNALLRFTENEPGLFAILETAVDLDIIPGEANIYNETICYFIINGNDAANPFQILDAESSRMTLRRPLDREDVPAYNLTILAKNDDFGDCQYPTDPPNPDSLLRVEVLVTDVKDTPPRFVNPGPVIPGGIRIATGTIGSSTSIILRGEDDDEDDPLTFSIVETSLNRSHPSLDPIDSPVFRLNDNNEILINFLANEAMQGYFTFTVAVHDSARMNATAQCKVYLTTDAHKVEFKFDNALEAFTAEIKDQVRQIFSDIYGFQCNIDNTRATTDDAGNPLLGKSTLETHFIDEDKSEPVPSFLITNLAYDDPVQFVNLTASLSEIGLNLDIRFFYEDTVEEPSGILTYLLIGAVVLLATVLMILSVTCWFNSRRLSLRVRALTASTFGSQKSGLDRSGSLDLPNTNQHAIQGSNPIWTTLEERQAEFDAESVGSGGSVLIGLENDDDFKNYAESGGGDDFGFAFGPSRGQGSVNPIFSEFDVDDHRGAEVSPEPFQPIVGRRNPLLMQDIDGI